MIALSIIFVIYGNVEDYIMKYYDLGMPSNQAVLESEMENFPVQSWLHINMITEALVMEELIFRKVFMSLFFRKNNFFNGFFAILLSSLIFGLLHDSSNVFYTLIYIISGIYLGLIYRISRDIRIPIIVHLISNFIAIIA